MAQLVRHLPKHRHEVFKTLEEEVGSIHEDLPRAYPLVDSHFHLAELLRQVGGRNLQDVLESQPVVRRDVQLAVLH